ncbi:hypothetical protein ABO04_10660 [Nitrosomonas sp. HPC101]|uniref:hypothetical protein n=1 Tax=Nitrosomonas sp. HPC101 TaxID=1658667 RepID=UPI00136B96AB|nr:hypothetical protein [Nitrosomonas sp. HPC101]MXS86339.1 hypothetical protein [Nitrosomonas sp. HPC101]
MDYQALWIVAVLGAATLIGVFWKMQGGFGPLNLRAVGLVLIAILASLLAIAKSDNLTAAMGILGAIAGYLFGAKADSGNANSNVSRVDASGANFGDNARVVGRDLNETVNNINARVQELGEILSQEGAKIDRLVALQETARADSMSYLVNTVYERGMEQTKEAMATVVAHWESEGWKLTSMSSDYQGMDGIFLLFERPSNPNEPKVQIYHSSRMNRQ